MRVSGRLVDEDDQPLIGLRVAAEDKQALYGQHVLGSTATRDDGRFSIDYSDNFRARLFHPLPNLRILVADRRGIRRLATTPRYERAPSLCELGDIVILRGETEGWLATRGTGHPIRVTGGNQVDFLVDNEAAFTAARLAIERAQRSIDLTQLFFEPSLDASPRMGPKPEPNSEAGVEQQGNGDLARALVAANRRGVTIRLALNENAVVPDSVDELKDALSPESTDNIELRVVRRNPAVMHEKLLLVDDREAWLIGSPFQQKYWDNEAHLPFDLRRGADTKPHHDVSVALTGPVVAHVVQEFARIWNPQAPAVTPDAPPLPTPNLQAAGARAEIGNVGDVTMQFVMSTPAIEGGRPERTILEAFERTLAQAERWVYIENQYLTSERAADALDHALDANRDLQAILLLNEHMDIPHYDTVQADIVKRLTRSHPRQIGMFSAYATASATALEPGRRGVMPIYIHSKVTIADDVCLSVGSANLDGASLHGARELMLPDALNDEANIHIVETHARPAVTPNGPADAQAGGVVRRLRETLWHEHLDKPRDQLSSEPPERWLAFWNNVANQNAETLLEGSHELRGRIVPLGLKVPRALQLQS